MLLNYIKLSFRLMSRNPFFTFIKVSGLAVGLAMFFILWQYTQSEKGWAQYVSGCIEVKQGVVSKWIS